MGYPCEIKSLNFNNAILIVLSTEEDVNEGMEEGQDELVQAGTSETTVEREISTTQPLNVPVTEGQILEGEHRGTPTTTAPFAQRLLSARSHLAPFSFPQVRSFNLASDFSSCCNELVTHWFYSGLD